MQKLTELEKMIAEILLDNTIQKKGNLTYKELAAILSDRTGKRIHYHGSLSNPLGNVSTLCFELGLPLISARVVYTGATAAKSTGEGFYGLVCGLKPECKDMSPEDAWRREFKRIQTCSDWSKLSDYLHGGQVVGTFPPLMKLESKVPGVAQAVSQFSIWMRKNTSLSDSSIEKYSSAINTISREMLERKVIDTKLSSLLPLSLDIAVTSILRNPYFIAKNQRGNNMYSNALKQYRYFIHSDAEMASDSAVYEEQIKQDIHLSETERTAIIQSRVGQGIFRKSIMEKYNGRCLITGIDLPKLLVASHIKPWAVSSNDERLSKENGLLLSATYDRLFDCGLITFDATGKIYLSQFIGPENKNRLRLSAGDHFDLNCTQVMKTFLEYHGDVLFVK